MADIVESLNVVAKEVFGDDGVPDLIPNQTKFQKMVPFSEGEKLGKKFVQTVRLAYPSGFTHAKGDGTAGAFSLNDSIGGAQARAEMLPYQTVLRDQMSYEDAAACAGNKQAFKSGTEYFFQGIQESIRKRLECEFFYGNQGLGTINGAPSTIHTTNKLVTISTAQWAAGIWIGTEGMQVDCYNGATLINTNAALVVVAVDVVNRTVEFSGNATDLGNLATTYTLYFRGAKGAEMDGIHSILNNAGTLFNIDASVYTLWKSTQYAPTSGALTFEKVKKAIALAVSKGLQDDVVLFMNPLTWDDVNSDIAALRKTDARDINKVDVGSEEIVYHSQNGKTSLVPTMFCKEGFAYGLVIKDWKRPGSVDVSFKTPGFGQDIFMHLQTKAGVEARAYTNQALICMKPGRQFVISNIVNKAL